ncbi:Succinate-semialdehyde dehydrogenase [NAD] [Nitrincola lacisaponensis]|uniref:Succinate-semialdehyde dehydrogenase [NAD] n=1 Tax=Nitrincola lacisaponensis TaxID=267850 RepID=A0A063Y6J4_9GAMM|nr:NAD-dependent succinate-semialdehyde dehydrogenase [Nitrincola lacisaponensis]KDE40386.1 Succinate-semialdehyde dehydrogenase [NAD] [Nitrincola lacisaponensis]
MTETLVAVINPATGEKLQDSPVLDAAALEAALQQARSAYQDWKQTSFAERAALLKAVAAKMREEVDSLAPLMTLEMGKPIKEARGEVLKAAWCAEHYAEQAEQYLQPLTLASDASHSYVQYLPLGSVLGILPWNAPFWLAFRFCAPALMAGNTCLMKHDLHVPRSAQAIADLFVQVGAPAGLMQNVPMGNAAVEAVIRDPRVQAVSLTGSDRAGSAVAAIAGAEIKPVVLELGGSDPCIVLADADLDKAADTITLSRIINAGQSCIAAKRIIIEDPVYDTLVEKLQTRLAALKLGDPALETTDVGPMARDDLRQNLHRQVMETRQAGARCLLGGELPDGPGFFYPVTLLADVTADMTAAVEETFGPVAVVMRARDAEHAVALANDSRYGLAAGLWTERSRGEQLARRLEVGQVAVNGIVKTDPRLPSGGIKCSGLGRELGPQGIHEFVNAQQVWLG